MKAIISSSQPSSGRSFLILAVAWLLGLGAGSVMAQDPPHMAYNCTDCHMLHAALGDTLTITNGNANLCLSCHFDGGQATAKHFVDADQARPWPGLPEGTNAAGNSHRWDSGPSGRLVFLGGSAVRSTGTILPSGIYTGAYSKTFTLTITNAGSGASGVARFNWTATTPGGGAGTDLLTGTNVPLSEGLVLTFKDGTNVSFQAGDQWHLYVRTDLRFPTNANMVNRMPNGIAVCSTCHDEHSQALAPFDPWANDYTTNAFGTFIGTNRHFMRVANDSEQLCAECHSPRFVTNAVSGSHPVGLVITTNAYYKSTANLPLEKTTAKVRCETCHDLHFSTASDGSLLRITNRTALCIECHTLADASTPAAHLSATNSGTLWPGGQYGSTFMQVTDLSARGSCLNCHQPHGWPDASNPGTNYTHLTVEFQENLCLTCHDTNGPATHNVQTEFAKRYDHPIRNNDPTRWQGRSVECLDCHNPHKALPNAHVYTNTATAARNLASNPLKGVSGVALNYASLTNFQTVATNLYTFLPTASGETSSVGATNEYQICFKCHSSYSFGSVPPAGLTPIYNTGTATFTANSTTVAGSGTAWVAGMTNTWIVRSNDVGRAYLITAVASTTSLTITPAYAGATGSGQLYYITAETDNAQEFSPMNRSGHPVMTGLNNYPNSTAPKALAAAAMKAPWASSLGTQTMMCSDCHSTDDTSAVAVQGPHGSAAQFMLRGTNTANWPNLTLTTANFNVSWCANCHLNSARGAHTSNHSSLRCYNCHIIIPHGGKMSRLIADRDGNMPARYAWNNNLANVSIYSFTKSGSSYQDSSCRVSCGHHTSGSSTSMENW